MLVFVLSDAKSHDLLVVWFSGQQRASRTVFFFNFTERLLLLLQAIEAATPTISRR